MTNGDSSKAIAIARSLEGINGLFTGCGIMCKRMSNFTTSMYNYNAHVIVIAFYQVASVQSVSCRELPNLSRHPPLNNPPHSCNVIILFIVNAFFMHQLAKGGPWPVGLYTSGPTHRLVPSRILHTGPNHTCIGGHA